MTESSSHEAFWVSLGAFLGFCLSVGGVFLLHPLGWLGGFVAGLLTVPLLVACINKGVQRPAQPTQPSQWQLVQPDPHRQLAPPPRVVVLPRSPVNRLGVHQ